MFTHHKLEENPDCVLFQSLRVDFLHNQETRQSVPLVSEEGGGASATADSEPITAWVLKKSTSLCSRVVDDVELLSLLEAEVILGACFVLVEGDEQSHSSTCGSQRKERSIRSAPMWRHTGRDRWPRLSTQRFENLTGSTRSPGSKHWAKWAARQKNWLWLFNQFNLHSSTCS